MDTLWELLPASPSQFVEEFPDLHPVVLQLLWTRGLRSQEAIDEFLHPDYGTDLHDPFLFSGMRAATARILDALLAGEKITVHGDYDADGVTGAAVLTSVFKEILSRTGRGVAAEAFDVYLPHREKEGYGLKEQTVHFLAARGTKLIITVDCGIASAAEVEAAKSLGLEVIVVDHHEAPPRLPSCVILHPSIVGETYPYKQLPAVSVAWKLAAALSSEARRRGISVPLGFEKWLLDLVAIATVTEIVPLLGENRTLLTYGLLVLGKTRRPGLQQLFAVAGLDPGAIDTEQIGFQIGPRINAASRMGDARTAYDMLTAESVEEGGRLAQALEESNLARRRLTDELVREALAAIGEVRDEPLLLAWREGWPTSMLGLVAGKIAERYYRPTILLGKNGDLFVGSGRSVPEFHITRALAARSDLLVRFGGHPAASGLTVSGESALAKLKEHLTREAAAALKGVTLQKKFLIDAVLEWEDVGWTLLESVEHFAPFGEGNRRPKFLIRGLRVQSAARVGAEGKHLRLMAARGSATRKMIGFGFGSWAERLAAAPSFDCVCELGVNTWNGNRELQLKIVDLKVVS